MLMHYQLQQPEEVQTICSNSSYTLTSGEATATHGTILWTTSNGLGTISDETNNSRLLIMQ
jgi:hypothetical protein